MRHWWTVLAIALLSGFAIANPASAAGFDCSKASSADEKAVCASPSLSALDSEMTGLWYAYSRIPMLMGSSGDRGDEAESFLARRHSCGADATCLHRAYADRIAQLKQQIAQWMHIMQCSTTGSPSCPQ
jgi:uncharacterized protein